MYDLVPRTWFEATCINLVLQLRHSYIDSGNSAPSSLLVTTCMNIVEKLGFENSKKKSWAPT